MKPSHVRCAQCNQRHGRPYRQAIPVDAPLSWRQWVGAILGGMYIFAVAFALVILGAAMRVGSAVGS